VPKKLHENIELIELEDAIALLVKHIQPQTNTKNVNLMEALNHHLAEDIFSSFPVPSFNRAAVDGYAVKSELTQGATKENPVKLKVLAEINAGDFIESLTYEEGQVVRIMTGAPIPDGFDSVIKQEDTDYGEEEALIFMEIKPFTNYGKIGEDISEGQLILKKSTRLTPVHIGILASLGVSKVAVLKPLKVGIFSSGSELAEINEPLEAGQIYDINRYVISSRLKEMNVQLIFSHLISDNIDMFTNSIKNTINSVDILITTGGVSVGKKDIMHGVMATLGAKRLFWRINMRPGTPVLVNTYTEKLILSLSGNPFGALTTFELLFRPMLSAFTDSSAYQYKRVKATLMNDFPKVSVQRKFIRARYESGQVFLIDEKHESSVLSSMANCNCFIDIKANTPKLKKGMEVEIIEL